MIIILLLSFAIVSATQYEDNDNTRLDVMDTKYKEMFETLFRRIETLEKDRDIDRVKIHQLELTVDAQNQVINALTHNFEEEVQAMSKELKSNSTSRNTRGQHIHESDASRSMRRLIRNTKRHITTNPVAFSAYLQGGLSHLGEHQNIVFDKTNVNTNDIYNPHHGVFIVPVSGIYVITTTVLATNSKELWADIVVNGIVKMSAYGHYTGGSQTVVLHLSQGDDVAVQSRALDEAVTGYAFSSFSGFLLFEEDEIQIVG